MRPGKVVRALVADDDRPIRDVLRLALEDEGYEVLEAGDGAATLEVLRASAQPLIVLLDLRMPGMDGAAVLRAVAKDARLARHHAFVLMTANGQVRPQSLVRLLSLLGVPVLCKPFELDDLLDTVEHVAQRLTAA
jgi:CheY-like chemotaxis protein